VKFIALLIVLALMQYWGSSRYLHKDQWYERFLDRVANLRMPAELYLISVVLLPAALWAWLLSLSGNWLFGLFGLALNVLLLLYCLGRRDYEGLLNRYREYCRGGNFEAAFLLARQEFPGQADGVEAADAEHTHRWMKQCLVYMGFERWFAVIFYFVLLGAPGALAYRLLHLLGELRDEPAVGRVQRRVLHVADWLPARLLVLAFALAGDYMGSREQVASSMQNLKNSAAEIISDAAHAALGLKSTVFSEDGDAEAFAQISDWEIGQLQGLLARSAVAWVLVISVVVLLA
jgi:AmpE protein